jgi:hypothetical protein
MKLRVIISLLVLPLLTSASPRTVKAYHKFVNNAELAIVESDFNKAATYYDSAFHLSEKAFGQDFYNASISAIKANRLSKALSYCKALARKGVGRRFFEDKPIFAPLTKKPDWPKILRTAELSRRRLLRDHNALIRTIDSLVEKDQLVNQQWRDAGMATAERQIMDLTYDTIQIALIKIFKKHGFISEGIIGVPLTTDNRIAYRLPFDVIIIHNYQSRMTGDTLFRQVLLKALDDGDIKPEYLATIEDFGGGDLTRPYYGSSHFYVQYKCSLFLENFNIQRIDQIDSSRKSIGLCTAADQLKKVLFNIQNPGNPFRIQTTMSKIGSFGDKESEQRMLDNSKVLVEKITNCEN